MIEILEGIYYNPKDGLPYSQRIKGTCRTNNEFKPIRTTNSKGYRQIWCGKCQTSLLWHVEVFKFFKGNVEKGMVVDHIDGNKLNNHIFNLQCITHSQNQGKKKPAFNSTGYPGVSKSKSGKFVAKIKVNNRTINLGHFLTPQEAYEVYKDAKIEHFGQHATRFLP